MPGETTPLSELSAEDLSALAARFDRPGPRYTSYPTAVQFSEAFGPDDYRLRLEEAAGRPGDPLSIYIHIPFCVHRCTYCGCQVIPTPKQAVADPYLDRLESEIDLTRAVLGARGDVKVLHLGGGTPTFLSPAQLARLFAAVDGRFPRAAGAELSCELDPRVTTEAHIAALRSAGVNRVSLGIQDFDPRVQEAIGRGQTAEQTERMAIACREAGFEGINFDLVYGLPLQTTDTIVASVRKAIELRPDRVAVYGYAHVPWMRPNQKGIRAGDLPRAAERLRLFLRASEEFLRGGYVQVGMDHFALPDDELAVACRSRRLGRNFMGYTPHGSLEIIGFGVSSIGHIAGAYAQNHKRLSTYYQMIDAGTFPIDRGIACTRDDDIRRYAIHQVLCNFRLDFADFRERAGAEFDDYFREEAADVEACLRDELIERDAGGISVTPLGRSFVRNVAMALDAKNKAAPGGPRFSRTV